MPGTALVADRSASLGHSYPRRRVNYMAGTVEQFGLWRGVRWTAGSISIIPTAVELANRLRLLWDRPALRRFRRFCPDPKRTRWAAAPENYEMLAEWARGLLSGEVSRPDEHALFE